MVDSNDLKAVAFILEERDINGARRKVPVGTAFFVEVPESSDLSWYYLATARHIIEDTESETLYVRANKKEDAGGNNEWSTRTTDWFIDNDADVAIILCDLGKAEGLDVIAWPLDQFVGADYRYHAQPFDQQGGLPVSVGHEIFITSLFIQHAGKERNLPIARFGHVARMPSRVKIKRWKDSTDVEVVAYLAECHSWGGHSGAPVIWLHPVSWRAGNGVVLGHVRAVLGMVSAHWDIAVKGKTTGDILGKIETDVNAGIAIVTPAEAIRQLLMSEGVMEQRKKKKEKLDSEEPMPKLDRAGEDEFSKIDFEAALKRTSRRISPAQPGEESPET